MAKPFEEIKLKEKTYGEHLKTEEGRSLLRWVSEQPVKEDDFKGWSINRNKWIKEQLAEFTGDVEPNRTMTPETKQVTNNELATMLLKIIDLLNKPEVYHETDHTEATEAEKKVWDE